MCKHMLELKPFIVEVVSSSSNSLVLLIVSSLPLVEECQMKLFEGPLSQMNPCMAK